MMINQLYNRYAMTLQLSGSLTDRRPSLCMPIQHDDTTLTTYGLVPMNDISERRHKAP